MGYMRHHAIVCTSWDENKIKSAHTQAKMLNLTVSELVSSPINSYWSFLVAPDGSKEWWPDSDAGNINRNLFIEFLKTKEGIRAYVDWAFVQYGDEGGHQELLDHHDMDEEED